MAVESKQSYQYTGSAASKKGTILTLTTVYGQLGVATAVTDKPIGILLEDVAAGDTTPQNCSVGSTNGEVYKLVASTAIAIGAAVGATTAGKAVTITLSTVYAQEWIVGIAISAAGADGDLVEVQYNPQIAS